MMLTVTELAKLCNLSRATILYYEREGLLQPAHRSDNGYRRYGETEIKRLETIAAYRAYGLPIASIKDLLDQDNVTYQSQLLRDHFNKLESEIHKLKQQQQAIVMLLQEPNLLDNKTINKARWVEIMRAAEFDDKSMLAWHRKFEEMEPDKHQQFLESLGIGAEEIKRIRRC